MGILAILGAGAYAIHWIVTQPSQPETASTFPEMTAFDFQWWLLVVIIVFGIVSVITVLLRDNPK